MTDIATAHSAAASVPTANASRYLQQLCKHWTHNLEVEFTPEHGRVTFPRNAREGPSPTNKPIPASRDRLKSPQSWGN